MSRPLFLLLGGVSIGLPFGALVFQSSIGVFIGTILGVSLGILAEILARHNERKKRQN